MFISIKKLSQFILKFKYITVNIRQHHKLYKYKSIITHLRASHPYSAMVSTGSTTMSSDMSNI